MRVDRDLLSWMPDSIRQILERLNRAGFAAYVVGGCVRDALLGRRPHDWDICTSALPQEVVACFTDRIVHLTGVKHGTVLVSWEGEGVEITTFRTEGGYSDHRHPDRVTFVRSLETDLARRDFTVNAMAYHPDRGVVDPFGGRRDLKKGFIRCVGVPEQRFQDCPGHGTMPSAVRLHCGGADFSGVKRLFLRSFCPDAAVGASGHLCTVSAGAALHLWF